MRQSDKSFTGLFFFVNTKRNKKNPSSLPRPVRCLEASILRQPRRWLKRKPFTHQVKSSRRCGCFSICSNNRFYYQCGSAVLQFTRTWVRTVRLASGTARMQVKCVKCKSTLWSGCLAFLDNYFQMPHTHFRKSVKQRRYPALLLNLCLQTRFAQAHHPAFSLLLSASQL